MKTLRFFLLFLLTVSGYGAASSWYVSPYGSDANAGTGPGFASAWLTIKKAVTNTAVVASGDTIYIAPGVYREVLILGTNRVGASVTVQGDPRNERGFTDATGSKIVASPVRWSNRLTSDKVVSGATLLTLGIDANNAATNYIWNDIWFDCSSSAGTYYAIYVPNSGRYHWFNRCLFTAEKVRCIIMTPAADQPLNIHFNQCIFKSIAECIYMNGAAALVAEVNLDLSFNDCLLTSFGNVAINIYNRTGTYPFMGIGVTNCTFTGYSGFIYAGTATDEPTVRNSLWRNIFNCGWNAIEVSTKCVVTNRYNIFNCFTPYTGTGIAAGPGEVANLLYDPLYEYGQSGLWFRRPQYYMMPTKDSPVLSAQSDVAAGTGGTDLFGRVRPSGSAYWGAGFVTNAIGAMEYHDIGTREETVVADGSYSLCLTGPGDHQISIPVNAQATTITILSRTNNTYTGTMPQIQRLAQPEMIYNDAGETVTSGDSSASPYWYTNTISFTPTNKTLAIFRLISNDTAGTGKAYFDKVTRNY